MIQVPKRIRPPTNCDPLLQTASGMGDVADFAKMAAALAQAKRFSNPIGAWSTGLEDLDRRDVALRSGALTIILGPSGVGSTILATGFVRTAARENARIGVVCVNEPMLHFVERLHDRRCAASPIRSLRMTWPFSRSPRPNSTLKWSNPSRQSPR